LIEKDIGGFDIAMDQSARVRILQCVSNNLHYSQTQESIWAIEFDATRKIRAVNQLRNDVEITAISLPYIENRDDMRMIERRNDSGLSEEALAEGRIDQAPKGDLDCDLSIQLLIHRAIDLPEAPLTEHRNNAIATE
jgi:hypothetical protein